MTSSRPRKPLTRLLRFSLSTMLLSVTAGAVWLGYAANRAREQRVATDSVLSLGGQVRLRHQSRVADLTYNHFPSSSVFDPTATPPGPAWLRKRVGDEYFQKVIYVDLEGQEVSEDVLYALSKLSDLRYLNLAFARIEDNGLRHLSPLTRLQCLYLGRNKISDAGLRHLANLRKLESLELDSLHRFDGSGLVHLSKLTELKKLSLQYLNIARSEYRHLRKLEGLKELFLSCSTTTDEDLQNVAGLESLIQLGIDRTKVTSHGLAYLTELPSLTHLYVNEEVAVGGVESLKQMRALSSISMEPSDTIENGPEKLRSALPGCQIQRW